MISTKLHIKIGADGDEAAAGSAEAGAEYESGAGAGYARNQRWTGPSRQKLQTLKFKEHASGASARHCYAYNRRWAGTGRCLNRCCPCQAVPVPIR